MEVVVEDLGALEDGVIEGELCSLAAHIAAATARLVLLLAEFDRRGGFGRWGCSAVDTLLPPPTRRPHWPDDLARAS